MQVLLLLQLSRLVGVCVPTTDVTTSDILSNDVNVCMTTHFIRIGSSLAFIYKYMNICVLLCQRIINIHTKATCQEYQTEGKKHRRGKKSIIPI